ncbi:ElyC/SanA/YdcF family protein [Nocardia macrotermitis]|uniref:ElyC/SanA/YdcF family protein n=1 Tax=Nocardia macrotermitis TaxID=2585198 RepID=UPI0029E81F92|nr:ElyC/SanA/YdcF family protein [Nocardia macrotermitis]
MKIVRRVTYLLAASTAFLLTAGSSSGIAAADNTPASLYGSAQAQFVSGHDAAGLRDLGRMVAAAPADPQALALQAIWADYAGDLITRETAFNRLGSVDPGMAAGARGVLGAIGAGVGTLPNPLPALIGPQTALVVLGYGLLPNGALRPELVNRLQAAWLQAIAAPNSPIVVTGGAPQNGVPEAAAMAGWLIGHGIPASRILVEDRSGSTVQNALFSTRIMRSRGIDSAVVITSPNHIRRAVTDFIVAGTRVVGAMTSPNEIISQLVPPSKAAQRGIYLDATRTFLPNSG